jgi:hypothetical protein
MPAGPSRVKSVDFGCLTNVRSTSESGDKADIAGLRVRANKQHRSAHKQNAYQWHQFSLSG